MSVVIIISYLPPNHDLHVPQRYHGIDNRQFINLPRATQKCAVRNCRFHPSFSECNEPRGSLWAAGVAATLALRSKHCGQGQRATTPPTLNRTVASFVWNGFECDCGGWAGDFHMGPALRLPPDRTFE